MRGISMTLTLIVLAGFYLATKDQPTADSAAPHHAQLAKAVEQLPDRLLGNEGEWVVIDRPPVPPAAQQLLRPNALTARVLRNEKLGAQASFIVVQCRDSRDMAGHYPPNCYPAHGWKWQEKVGAPSSVQVTHAGKAITVPYQLYRFRQPGFPRERQIKIYSFFAIPGRGLVPDIGAVRKAAEDYRVRPYGAAQIQVIFDGGVEDAECKALFADLMGAAGELVGTLSRDPLLDVAPAQVGGRSVE
jgi:hypothetical protein